ncbi:MAG: hypothetical protein R3E31_21680 [Chloroflexota bacterium]
MAWENSSKWKMNIPDDHIVEGNAMVRILTAYTQVIIIPINDVSRIEQGT